MYVAVNGLYNWCVPSKMKSPRSDLTQKGHGQQDNGQIVHILKSNSLLWHTVIQVLSELPPPAHWVLLVRYCRHKFDTSLELSWIESHQMTIYWNLLLRLYKSIWSLRVFRAPRCLACFQALFDNADGFLLQEQRQKHRLRQRPEDYARGPNYGFWVQIFYSVGRSFGFAFPALFESCYHQTDDDADAYADDGDHCHEAKLWRSWSAVLFQTVDKPYWGWVFTGYQKSRFDFNWTSSDYTIHFWDAYCALQTVV